MNRISRFLKAMADSFGPIEEPIEWPDGFKVANWKVCYKDWKGQLQTKYVWDINDLKKISRYAFAHVRKGGSVSLYVRTGPHMGTDSWTLVYQDQNKRGR